eukprot:365000-Chlamydomonas_euryale.AAC.5
MGHTRPKCPEKSGSEEEEEEEEVVRKPPADRCAPYGSCGAGGPTHFQPSCACESDAGLACAACTAQVLKRREKEDALRLSMLKNQPSTITHYTPTGFAKTKCPRALWQALRGYFDVNKRHAKIEHWHDWQIFTSQYDAQALHTPILEGDFLKPRLNAIIQPMLSAWAGGVNLEPTAMYGVRAYTRGAWLKNHVDMRGTHIISAIVNIDQDVDEPWPLEIRDHAGGNVWHAGVPLHGKARCSLLIHLASAVPASTCRTAT